MTEEDHVREELGAYVLGALGTGARRHVEAHVAACATCRDELAHLSALPPLLDRITADEATADLDGIRARLATTAHRAATDAHRRTRQQVRRWQAVAAAACLVALVAVGVAWAPWEEPPDRLVVQVVPIADTAAVDGTVAAYAWEWGTTLELEVADLPERPAYLIWAVAEDGRRERAGTWGPTRSRGATVRAASAILRPELATVEVTDPDGQVLFAADFAS
jgi:anti-sigma factor RsiW